MNSDRRRWLVAGIAGAGLVGLAAWRLWPDEGLFNPCLGALPAELADHPLVRKAWQGLDPQRVWDGHAHYLTAEGDGHVDGGPWPHWLSAAQARLIANAACVPATEGDFGHAYLAQLTRALAAMPAGYKVLLLAMDGHYDEAGRLRPELTHFSVANDACLAAARSRPDRYEWAASIHPYRADAIAELARVAGLGARAIKWLPSAQGIDPASSRCDAFYAALARHRLPLISHAGAERATPGDDRLGNPLRLRRALDHGVRVVVAHCATMGTGRDLDRGDEGPEVDNFDLFERLMAESRYDGLLFGDLAAIPQMARSGTPLRRILERAGPGGDWSHRLLHGSDFPVPGLMPLYSCRQLAAQGLLDPDAVAPLVAIRHHNAILFDFVLKRHLRWQGRGLADEVFHSRDFFESS